MGPTGAGARRGLLLAVLVGALFAGLVGMHHVVAAPGTAGVMPTGGMAAGGMTAPVDPARDHPDGGGHDGAGGILHLCLAVLVAVAVVVFGRWLLGSRPAPVTRAGTRPPPVRAGPRAPPSGAPARLALLCVSRT